MKRIAVLSSFYPSSQAPYAHMFVHTRSRYYKSHGCDVEVFVPSKWAARYELDGIPVHKLPARQIVQLLGGFDAATVHLLYHRADRATDADPVYDCLARSGLPLLFFIHGVEVQSIWRSRRADIALLSPRSIARWLYRDHFLLQRMKRTVRRFLGTHSAMKFVAPSLWMFEEARETLGIDLLERGAIIPNGIDTTRFGFGDRWEHRHRLLTLRPLEWGGKYAVDLAVEAAAGLPNPFELELIGRGRDEALVREWLSQHDTEKRVRINTTFLPHAQIAGVHREHGIYLGVTRMDAQGVSMCEAMASGLPVVSFDVCAIPEFIAHNETGLLVPPYDLDVFREQVTRLATDRATFGRIAEAARAAMEDIDIERTTADELATLSGLAQAPESRI